MQCNGKPLTKEQLAEKNQEQKEPIPPFQKINKGSIGVREGSFV